MLGPEHINTLRLRRAYADSYFSDDAASAHELREAVTTLEELDALARRVYGEGHAYRLNIYASLKTARKKLAGVENARETPPPAGAPVQRTFAKGWLDDPS